jgi:hypothetical protein
METGAELPYISGDFEKIHPCRHISPITFRNIEESQLQTIATGSSGIDKPPVSARKTAGLGGHPPMPAVTTWAGPMLLRLVPAK